MCSPGVEGSTRKGTFLLSMANSTMVNLSITIESNLFVGNKYRASAFLKKQRKKRGNSRLTHCSKKKMNNKHSQVFVKIGAPNVYKKS